MQNVRPSPSASDTRTLVHDCAPLPDPLPALHLLVVRGAAIRSRRSMYSRYDSLEADREGDRPGSAAVETCAARARSSALRNDGIVRVPASAGRHGVTVTP